MYLDLFYLGLPNLSECVRHWHDFETCNSDTLFEQFVIFCLIIQENLVSYVVHVCAQVRSNMEVCAR